VESYFFRANDPRAARAVWLKATVLVPRAGPPVAEAWCIVFDGVRGRTWAGKTTVPLSAAQFAGDGPAIAIADTRWALEPDRIRLEGELAAGQVRGAGVGETAAGGGCRWSLQARALDDPHEPTALAEPLRIYPAQWMIDGGFPRAKLLTPRPALRWSGHLEVFGERIAIDDWVGMQGHNWGAEHSWEYAWGQCPFLDAQGRVHTWVEGFTGRVRVGPLVTPRLSALVVRRAAREYRFDRVFRPWTQRATLVDLRWTLAVQGAAGRARIEFSAAPERTVCLGYDNPARPRSYCLNSKLAQVRLEVWPADDEPFRCESAHGGALEFLRNAPDPRFTVV
jgi:hypothetical protein